MRCCKDLGVASELWDPRFIREFKAKYCVEVFAEHVPTKKKCVSHVLLALQLLTCDSQEEALETQGPAEVRLPVQGIVIRGSAVAVATDLGLLYTYVVYALMTPAPHSQSHKS